MFTKGQSITLPSSISASFTKYHIAVRAFTKKREGPASDALVVTTDTLPPGAPVITNITCQNANEILLEWHRPNNQGWAPREDAEFQMISIQGTNENESSHSSCTSVAQSGFATGKED